MKKFIIIFIMVLTTMTACSHTSKQPDFYKISDGIINREASKVPLIVQSCDFIESITIDSLVFIRTSIEPYNGYLVTTVRYTKLKSVKNGYKFIRKVDTLSTKCLIPIDSLIIHKTSYQWQTNWNMLYTIDYLPEIEY